MKKATNRAVEKHDAVAILGFAREGQSLLRYLKRSPRFRSAAVWILDRDPKARTRLGARESRALHWQTGPGYLARLERFLTIFRSPGIPYLTPALTRARRRGAVLSSATKLFFENIHNLPSASKPRIIGVTGTKGKGTTSTLIAEILRAAGFRTILAGNIGKPMLDALGAAAGADFVVLELSSFQLQDLRASPDIAVVLDVFPDHLDAHGSTHEYLEAKSNIGRHQRARDALFYFAENPLSRRIAAQSDARKFSVRAPDTSLKNFKMAEAVTSYLGVGAPVIQRTIAAFTGLEHRLEIVRRTARLTFVNDSAATNPAATALAVRSFPAPIVLIAGGRNKGLNYAPLGRAIRESSRVSAAVLFGENREELKRMLRRSNPDLHVSLAQDLREATRQAVKFARTLHATPEHRTTVLFSPASASFDQFESYVDRGDQFKRIVRKTSIGKE